MPLLKPVSAPLKPSESERHSRGLLIDKPGAIIQTAHSTKPP